MRRTLLIAACIGIAVSWNASAGSSAPSFTDAQKQLIAEHAYKGLPSTENIHVRNAYVLSYNPTTRTPNWVAYHVRKDYRNTPSRKGWAKSFRVDPDIANEAKDAEYNGLHTKRGYATRPPCAFRNHGWRPGQRR